MAWALEPKTFDAQSPDNEKTSARYFRKFPHFHTMGKILHLPELQVHYPKPWTVADNNYYVLAPSIYTPNWDFYFTPYNALVFVFKAKHSVTRKHYCAMYPTALSVQLGYSNLEWPDNFSKVTSIYNLRQWVPQGQLWPCEISEHTHTHRMCMYIHTYTVLP